MEKKTFGNFLAILRKAKGMTQKELAELVNVSDKAVVVGNEMKVCQIYY